MEAPGARTRKPWIGSRGPDHSRPRKGARTSKPPPCQAGGFFLIPGAPYGRHATGSHLLMNGMTTSCQASLQGAHQVSDGKARKRSEMRSVINFRPQFSIDFHRLCALWRTWVSPHGWLFAVSQSCIACSISACSFGASSPQYSRRAISIRSGSQYS